ncbi:MAG TPA: hypothetical protein VMD76_07125 [Candidatus Sulfotelmatobacter sp.]|jgi:hypothetical protein|nr:hypothetical protein [Candidatus Sulfotelmatobacter sp.]
MTKEKTGTKTESSRHHAVTRHDGFELVESYLPAGSAQRAAAGVTAAAAGALLAAAVLGVGPAALAGAAGYLVYHETHRS